MAVLNLLLLMGTRFRSENFCRSFRNGLEMVCVRAYLLFMAKVVGYRTRNPLQAQLKTLILHRLVCFAFEISVDSYCGSMCSSGIDFHY